MSPGEDLVHEVTSATIDPTLGLGEFLSVMQLFSNKSQAELADGLGVSQQTVSRWQNGKTSPTRESESAKRIMEIFELTQEAVQQLLDNNYPNDSMEPRVRQRTAARRRIEERSKFRNNEVKQMLGAFTMRAEHGPPLNEVEAELIKFLVQHNR